MVGVAEHPREIVVDRTDRPVDVEFDDRLRLADGGELAFVVRGAQLLFGDVGGVFDHLDEFAVRIRDRIVGSLHPDFPSILAHAPVLAAVEFTTCQLVPQRAILGAAARSGIDQHAVVLSANLVERVTHHVEEIFVGVEDSAVHAELGHRLRLADRRNLASIVRVALIAFAQRALHRVERAQQLAGFVFAGHVDLIVELPVLDGPGHRHGIAAAAG